MYLTLTPSDKREDKQLFKFSEILAGSDYGVKSYRWSNKGKIQKKNETSSFEFDQLLNKITQYIYE